MKVVVIDLNNIVVYLKDSRTSFNDKESLEDYFIKLFSKLRDYYNINISGYYNIKMYIDKFYGSVIEIIREDIDYLDYFDSSVDMRASIPIKCDFLYRIDDYFWLDKDILKKVEIYLYNNDLYLKVIKNLNNIEWGKILEYSKIIYKDNNIKLEKMLKMY